MKILLAPSETKSKGGNAKFNPNALFSSELENIRIKLMKRYKELLEDSDKSALMFGLKKSNEVSYYQNIALSSYATKAILRYTGVAFEYLDYSNLSDTAQTYIDNNILIFSNLFGVTKACDMLPEYRLKQGAKIGDIEPDRYYKQIIAKVLDSYLENEDILDIRAGYYDRFYIPNKSYTTLKFLKDGKVVSHWAKAYRGKVLRKIAQHQITTIKDFIALPINGLELLEIQTRKNKTEIIYNIRN